MAVSSLSDSLITYCFSIGGTRSFSIVIGEGVGVGSFTGEGEGSVGTGVGSFTDGDVWAA